LRSRQEYTLFETAVGTCGIAWQVVGNGSAAPLVTAFQLPEATARLVAARTRSGSPPVKARAVGQVLARNPIPLIIPCHRVLAVGNRPGGFSAPGGLATKAKMLGLEGEGFTEKAG
jgi:alkylated DNA nucleotide flippase Atl1